MSASGASDLIGRTPGGRKLIAVVHADMVGYSRLIGLDDSGTLERLRRLRSNLIDPATEEHGGRIVNTGGDSLLIVFDSVDGAVRWAVKVQQDVPACDGDQPPDRAIRFRVGIDAGDVIPEGTDVHGDVVNVAARLQAACPPSGICVSRAVREHVRGRLDLRFEELGHLALKNIVRPVEAFVLRLDPNERFPVPAVRRRPTMRPMVLGSLAALLLALGLGAAWWLHRDGFPPIAESPRASAQFVPPAVGLSSAPRLSLVVLPFDKFGGEGVEDYIVDGITEDLTTDLSRLPGFLVIARNSAFTYKGKPIDVKRVGEELGVRYAVEGSVRNAGGSLRVNAQLVSTETGAHIWADRFDVGRDVGDSVDDIVRHIARQLNGQIVDTESARGVRERPANPDATDVLLRARALNALPRNPQRQAQIVALFERAVELDPMSATAVAELGNAILDSTLKVSLTTRPYRRSFTEPRR